MDNFSTKKNRALNMRNRTLRKQAGFTLIELGVVVAIGAVISIAGVLVVPKMLAENNAKKLSDALTLAIPKIQSAYQNRTSYNGLTATAVAKNGWIADSLIEKKKGVPTGNLITPWAGGSIVFVETEGKQAKVTVTAASPAVCNSLATNFLSNDMLLTANINGTSVKELNLEVNYAETGEACTKKTSNSIEVVFGRS
jgi:prepilin-type N-terminal cleavage/methylation domain-containing protein